MLESGQSRTVPHAYWPSDAGAVVEVTSLCAPSQADFLDWESAKHDQ